MAVKIRELVNNMRALREALNKGENFVDYTDRYGSYVLMGNRSVKVEIRSTSEHECDWADVVRYSDFISESPENQARLEAALEVALKWIESFSCDCRFSPARCDPCQAIVDIEAALSGPITHGVFKK